MGQQTAELAEMVRDTLRSGGVDSVSLEASLIVAGAAGKSSRHALALAEKVGRFIMGSAERTGEGGLCHFMGKKQLWVDTLFMCCPFLKEWTKSTGNTRYQDEAIHQLKIHIKHLQDSESGLFVHMWDEASRERTTDLWGRGNGWAAMSLVEVLKDMNPDSPDYPFLLMTFEKFLSGILKHQDKKSGLWHTILDDPETYLESSASAMFLYALLLNRKHNIVDTPCDPAIQKAMDGLVRLVQDNSVFSGVSEGTDPSDKSEYASRKSGSYTWGTGAFLLAACEYISD